MSSQAKFSARVLSTVVFVSLCPLAASAGFLDKLNEVNKKLEASNQQQQAKNAQSGGGNFGGSLSAGLGATEFNALSDHQSCFDSLKGLRARITADKIAQKMATVNPVGADRKAWEEDIASWRAAQKAGSDSATPPDPKNPNRGTDRLTTAEQTDINAQFGAKYNEVVSGCQGRDHMNAGHTTKMNYIHDNSATEASAAKQASAMGGYTECIKSMQGLRMRITADVLTQKLSSQKNLSDKDRQDWEADIASFRAAADQNQMMPAAVDPKQPTRAMQRLAMDDQIAINQQYATASQQEVAKCSAMASGGQADAPASVRHGGLVDHATSPSNPNAPRQTERRAMSNKGIGGSTNLEYMRRTAGCENAIKGHLAKLTADKLEAKLKAASGLTPQKRQEWEEDIAAWRVAERSGADAATPPDPNNPYRWYDYVTNKERQEINMQHGAFSTKVMKDCAKQDAGL